jgi:pimeloyl-ACP methyl ester carboxylesterase
MSRLLGTRKSVRLKNLEISYLEDGDPNGLPVVFLHGFPDDALSWDSVVERLGSQPLRFLRPWQRGFGGSIVVEQSARSGQTAALAQDVLDFADTMKLDRFVLVGHDWGSRAAHGVAILAPDRLSGLIALATPYGQGTVAPETKLRQEQAFWYQWFFQTPHGQSVFRQDEKLFCRYLWGSWSPRWQFTSEEYDATARSFGNPQFVETVLHYYAHRWANASGSPVYAKQQELIDGVPKISVRTIFACGAEDRCNLPEISRANERFYGGYYRRVEIANAGHFMQRENPERVAELIRELLALP